MRLIPILLLLLMPNLLSAKAVKGTCTYEGLSFMGVSLFEGKGCEIKGSVKKSGGSISGNFSVDLTKLDTGINSRNKHMRGYLKTKKFPHAKVYLDKVSAKPGTRKFTGKLRLKGVVQKISGKIKFKGNTAVATFKVDVSKHGVGVIKYKSETLGPEINVKATFTI